MINEILLLLLRVAIHAYTLIVLLRLILQLTRADFYNPLSQFIVRATNPLLNPLRKIIPGFFGIDFAAIVLAFLVQVVGYFFIFLLMTGAVVVNPLIYLVYGLVGMLDVLLGFYFFAILIVVVISWVAPGSPNPAVQLINDIIRPLMDPIRRVIPSAGGLDFSPMILMLILVILRSIVLPSLKMSLGVVL